MNKKNRKPVIRFKAFNDPWEQRKLAEIGDIVTGSTPSTQRPEYYSEDGIPWVTPTDITNAPIKDSQKKLSELGAKVGRVVPAKSILVTCIASIGKNALLEISGSFNQQINALIPNQQKYFPYFLFTESHHWSNKMKRKAAAGTMQIVTKKEFSCIATYVPKLAEQIIIGKLFEELDQLITLHQRKLDKLQNVKKACLEKMFPQNGESVPRIRFKGFTDTWEQRKLSSLCSLFTDGDWIESKDQSNFGIRLIQTGNIGITEFIEKIKSRKWISENTFNRLHCEAVFPGDILISRLPDPAGRACIVPNLKEKMITAVDCTIARVDAKFCASFLIQSLSTSNYFSFVNTCLAGGTRQRISRSNLSNYEVSIPSKKIEQKQIGQYFKLLDSLITLHQRKLDKLKNLKKACLEKMFV